MIAPDPFFSFSPARPEIKRDASEEHSHLEQGAHETERAILEDDTDRQ
jgi:hypothetical protein